MKLRTWKIKIKDRKYKSEFVKIWNIISIYIKEFILH